LKLKVAFKVKMLGAMVLAIACGCAGRVLPVAGPADVARGAHRYPDITAGELASGRQLFASHCGACHAPPSPASKAPEVWPGEIHEMKERAKLDDAQVRLVERYLVTMAQAQPL
jgi:mono/diheme cytochrome c family protein